MRLREPGFKPKEAQERALRQQKIKATLLHNKPHTPEQLHQYIKSFMGLHLARNKVCPHHSAPFDFVSNMFFEAGEDNCAVLASRDSGKTRLLSVLTALNIKFKAHCECAIVGAILTQANKGFSYLREYHEMPFLSPMVDTSKMELTTYTNKSKVEIVCGTATGVNSPHPNILLWDEVDLTQWDILQQGFSMPHSSDFVKSQIVLASTRKHAGVSTGAMQEVLDRIENKTMPFWDVYSWCIWEVMEKCTESSCDICKHIFRFNEEGVQESFADLCEGKAKQADGHYPLKEVWKKFTTLDVQVFDSEWLCRRPGRAGRMFPMFDENVHVIDYEKNINLPTYAGQDFGFSNPAVTLLCQVDSSDNAYIFGETVEREKTETSLCSADGAWRNIYETHYPVLWACDPENPSAIATMVESGLPAVGVSNKRLESIALIRHLLRPPNSPTPKLFIDRKCSLLRWELMNWQKAKNGEDGVKKDDHCLAGDTLVDTVKGQKKIEDLVGKTGEVYCFDERNKIKTTSLFHSVRETFKEIDTYEIELEDGRKIEATADHMFLTDKGWLPLFLLTEEDSILDISSGERKRKEVNAVGYVKIKSIKKKRKQPVYNMHVDSYHNFCVHNLLISHNSIDALRYILFYLLGKNYALYGGGEKQFGYGELVGNTPQEVRKDQERLFTPGVTKPKKEPKYFDTQGNELDADGFPVDDTQISSPYTSLWAQCREMFNTHQGVFDFNPGLPPEPF